MAATHRVARGVGPDDDECLPGARRGVPTAAMQRRAALEFITRELRSLEVEATLKGALEDQAPPLRVPAAPSAAASALHAAAPAQPPQLSRIRARARLKS